MVRPAQILLALCLLGPGLLSLAACQRQGSGGRPIAWPSRAYVGETVAVAIDSNEIPILELAERHNASPGNVIMRLINLDDPGNPVEIPPRAVIAGGAGRVTHWAEARPGTEVTVAIFDLPDMLGFPTGFPATVEIHTLIDGVILGNLPAARLTVLGSAAEGTGPLEFYPTPALVPGGVLLEESLAPRPAIRLRALQGTPLDLTWDENDTAIGGLEFEIVYPPSVASPDPIPAAEAERGTTLVRPVAEGRAHVLLVDPRGFQLVETGLGPGNPIGTGPFLDVAFDKSAPFAASEFEIRNLYVTDLDGNVLLDDRGNDSTTFFHVYARSND
jgi:hypothetical protein